MVNIYRVALVIKICLNLIIYFSFFNLLVKPYPNFHSNKIWNYILFVSINLKTIIF